MLRGSAATGSTTGPCTTPCRSSPTSTTSRAWPMGSAWSRKISSSVGECDADHVASAVSGGDIDLPPAPGRPCRAWVPRNRRTNHARSVSALPDPTRCRRGGRRAGARGPGADLRRVQGFAAYYLVHAGNDTLSSIALFQTEESAAVGERLLNDWFRHDWPVFQAVPPKLARGAVLVHEELPRGAAAVTTGPRLERRNWSDRRRTRERRSGGDRRVATAAVSMSATP